MRTLTKRHTAKYLAEIILQILSEYRIEIRQLFSFTSDNGSNVVKTGINLSYTQQNTTQNTELTEEEFEFINTKENNKIVDLETNCEEIPVEEDIIYGFEFDEDESQMFNDRGFELEVSDESAELEREEGNFPIIGTQIQYEEENVLKEVAEEMRNRNESILVNVRCACHTIELVISDFCKLPAIKELIKVSNDVITNLRTPVINGLLTHAKLKRAKVRAATRWHSLNDSLDSLLFLKNFCKGLESQMKKLYISDENWLKLQSLKNTLRVLCEAVIKSQNSQLTLPDFYHVYNTCKLDLIKLNNEYSNILLSKLENRSNHIIGTKIMNACLFLDPRYQFMLSNEQKETSIAFLSKIYSYYYCNNITLEEENIRRVRSCRDSFDVILNEKKRESNLQSINSSRIESLLRGFNDMKYEIEQDIFHFWNSIKLVWPELYLLFKIVFAVPATQVSVERAFSTLKFIYSDLRERLNSDLLEDILTINLNNSNFKEK